MFNDLPYVKVNAIPRVKDGHLKKDLKFLLVLS